MSEESKKLLLSWLGLIASGVTLSRIVMLATLVFTLMQIYVLWRDKIKDQK